MVSRDGFVESGQLQATGEGKRVTRLSSLVFRADCTTNPDSLRAVFYFLKENNF